MVKLFNKLFNIGTLLSTAGFVGATVVQIFARFFLASAPSWTEEAARLFFIYAVSFAAGMALHGKYYVELDIFYRKFSKRFRFFLDVFIQVSTIVLFAVMGFYALQYIKLGSVETSPSLRIPMSFAFISIFIMSATVIIYTAVELVKLKSGKK